MAIHRAEQQPLVDPAPAIAELQALLGERLSTNATVREQHGQDLTHHQGLPPDAVAFAQSTEEVSQIVKICAKHKLPIVPFGTGTSLEGHITAIHAGLCIDLSQMNQILEVNQEDLDCRVQAGVTRKQLNEYVRDQGLMFPIDPGADASLGGMTATCASGTNAVRYGTMRDNVLGLTVVMADGRIVKTGGRSRKSSAGYNLTGLLVGSEGTLGVITEIQLRLYGIPDVISAAVCPFEDLEGAVNTVITVIQAGIPVSRIELLDEIQLKAINAYSKTDYPEQPTLFFEFQGTERAVAEQVELTGAYAKEFGASDFQWAKEQEDRNRLWQARHDVWFANLNYRPGCKGWATDVCVPISRLAECILETRKDIDDTGLIAPIVGHVGDGNFHTSMLLNRDDPEEMAKADAFNDRLIMRALAMGGTCTGEHGIGSGKMDLLESEHPTALPVMRAIKQALDPDNIMNPGKVLRV